MGWEDSLEKGRATHSSILAWRIPWTVQFMGLRRVGHIWATFTFEVESRCFPGGASGKEPACQHRRHKRHRFHPWVGKISWRRAWQPPPVFLSGESPWTEEPGRLQTTGSKRVGHYRSDIACTHKWNHGLPKWLSGKESACEAGDDPDSIPGSGSSPGEGNGNPLQFSCLGNPMDRGAWQVTQSTGSQESYMT